MDSKSVDGQVTTVLDLSFQFCLKLPRHVYDVTADSITPLKYPPNTVPSNGTTRALFNAINKKNIKRI